MNSPSNSICTTVSKRPAELKPNDGISLLLAPARILQHKEGVIEDGYGLFEGDAVLALILRGFRLIPAEARASVLEDAVHAWSLLVCIYTVNTDYRMRGRPP